MKTEGTMAEEKRGSGKDDTGKRGRRQLIYKELESDWFHLFHLWHWIQERRHWRQPSKTWRRIIFNPETENPIPNWVQQQSKYIFRHRGLRSFISHALFLGNLLEGVLLKNKINQERKICVEEDIEFSPRRQQGTIPGMITVLVIQRATSPD